MSKVPLYDDLAEDYDRFVNWEARLAFEMPFLRSLFQAHRVQTVLDTACGTGRHALALAGEGYRVTGTDISPNMIAKARQSARSAGAGATFEIAGFGALRHTLNQAFDAILCLGNSLPHITDVQALHETLVDFAASLNPGGILLLQNRNLDRVLLHKERFMPPQLHREENREWLFFRFYDFGPVTLRFNMVTLYRDGDASWQPAVGQTELRPWRQQELCEGIRQVRLEVLHLYGSYEKDAFDPQESGDLVLVARRPLD
jgi:glycine/sarcosine N-methyltransferase